MPISARLIDGRANTRLAQKAIWLTSQSSTEHMHPKSLISEALSRGAAGCAYIRKFFMIADRFSSEVSNAGALDSFTSPEPALLRQAMVRPMRAFEPALMPPSHILETSMRNTTLVAATPSTDVPMKLSGRAKQSTRMALQLQRRRRNRISSSSATTRPSSTPTRRNPRLS